MKMDRSFGKAEAMVDSASRFVVIYRFGKIGAPAAADMKRKVFAPAELASSARVIAVTVSIFQPQGYYNGEGFVPESLFINS